MRSSIKRHAIYDIDTYEITHVKSKNNVITKGQSCYHLKLTYIIKLSQAYKAGLYGNKYLWVLPGWFYEGWYKISGSKLGCTTDQIYEVIKHYLATYRSFNRYDNKTMTISGKVRLTRCKFEIIDLY